MDPVHQPYAPPAAPIEPAQPGRATGDPLGWVLLATPVAAGIGEALLGDLPGTVLAYVALAATWVLIGVDAHKHGQPAAKHVVGAVLLWLVFFPLYIHRRAAWGAPQRLPFAIIGVGVFLAGAFYQPLVVGPARAYVRCKPAGKTLGDGFDCSIEHQNGSRPVHVCWDVVLTCANGPGGSGHACGDVAPKQTSSVPVPFASLTGATGCDKLTKIGVENLKLTSE